jgi:aspartate racemase
MQADLYPKVFSRAGIEIRLPSPAEQEFIHERYLGELVKGVIRPATRKGFLTIIETMKNRDSVEGVVLGGTEMPLCLRKDSHRGILLLDTAKLHVRAVMNEALG